MNRIITLSLLALILTLFACDKSMDDPEAIPFPSTFVFDRVELDLNYYRVENESFIPITEADFLAEVPDYDEAEIVAFSNEFLADLVFTTLTETELTFEGLEVLDGMVFPGTYERNEDEVIINAEADTIFQNPVFRLVYEPMNQELIYEGAVIVSAFESLNGMLTSNYTFDFVAEKRTLQDLQNEIIDRGNIEDGRPIIVGFARNVFKQQ